MTRDVWISEIEGLEYQGVTFGVISLMMFFAMVVISLVIRNAAPIAFFSVLLGVVLSVLPSKRRRRRKILSIINKMEESGERLPSSVTGLHRHIDNDFIFTETIQAWLNSEFLKDDKREARRALYEEISNRERSSGYCERPQEWKQST